MSKKEFCLVGVLALIGIFGNIASGNLIAQWEFEGDANDSVNGFVGTLMGDANIINDPQRGWVLNLDGTGDYVYVDDNDLLDIGTGDWSIWAWVKTSPVAEHREVVWKGNSATGLTWYDLRLDRDGFVRSYLDDGVSAKFGKSDDSADDNTWHHIAVTFDRDVGAQAFIDGRPNGSLSDISGASGDVSNSNPFTIGRRESSADQYFNGLIDDIRIFSDVCEPNLLDLWKAYDPVPVDGANDVNVDVVLEWSPGFTAGFHDVYFGANFDDVNDANTVIDPCNVYMGRQDLNDLDYDPCGILDVATSYYWRIDEVNGTDLWKGDMWELTVVDPNADYDISGEIDYNDLRIFQYYWLTGKPDEF